MNKKIRIAVPFNTAIDPEAQISVFNVALYLQSKGFMCEPKFSEGTYLSTQRNSLSWMALQKGQDILFVDSDMVFGPAEVDKLLNADKDIIGGLYYARRAPYFPVVYRVLREDDLVLPDSYNSEIIEGDNYFGGIKQFEIPDKVFTHPDGLGVGTGFLYIKHHILKKMWSDEVVKKFGRPFNFYPMLNGDEIKEDLAFCLRAKKIGFEVFCQPATAINLIHLGKLKINKNAHLDHVGRERFFYSNDIQGWMNFNELNWLYQKAKKMDGIVEIGSWKGRSTHALLSGTQGKVTAVDTFCGRAALELCHEETSESVLVEFKKNTDKFQNLEVVIGDSVDTAKSFKDKSVDMVFIDGGHGYGEVKADLLAWEDKPRKLLCGHDYTFDGVYNAVKDVLGTVEQYETLWIKEVA